MSSELQALRYLSPDRDSFWDWSEDGAVVTYRNGGTLAFREQILAIVKNFGDQLLPPLELILLILAACRDTWPEDRKIVQSETLPLARSARPILRQWWNTVFDALERVHAMPRQIRSNPAAITAMLEIVFERKAQSFRPASPDLVKILSTNWMKLWGAPEPQLVPFGERTQNYSILTQGLLRITVDEVLNRTATSLEKLPEPADAEDLLPEELPEVRTVRHLLDEIEDDDEFRGLVRVVKTLSAVLTLPRDLSTPEELPQGGVSDIANRGPLDRLLLSELAHDDDTLMTRIALNEALYIRRETPPSHPFRERVLLIDAGIRMWGLPRLCAAAVGLCLASQKAAGETVRIFRSDQDGLQPVDFTTRDGLAAHLAALDCLAHPGSLLPEWIEEIERDSSVEADRILITGEDVLGDPEFRRAFRDSRSAPAFVVTVNREGRVQLLQCSGTGEKKLRELWLDLDALAGTTQQPQKSLVDRSTANQLPAILRLPRLPLRMPYPMSRDDLLVPFEEESSKTQDLLQITRDRRLLLWDAAGRGGRQVTDTFPSGMLRWSGWLMNTMTYVQSFAMVMVTVDSRVSLIQLRRGSHGAIETEKSELKFWTEGDVKAQVLDVYSSNHVLMIVLRTQIVAVFPATGERLASAEIPDGLSRESFGFFTHRSNKSWFKANYWNGQVRFDKILDASHPQIAGAKILGILGSGDEMVAVLSTGELFWLKDQRLQPVTDRNDWKNSKIVRISQDRNSCEISPHRNGIGRLKLKPNSSVAWYPVLARFSEAPTQLPTDESVFRNLSCLEYGDRLAIITKTGNRFVLDVRAEKNSPLFLRPAGQDEELSLQKTAPFEEIPGPPGVGYTLREVKWKDGSRAVLDSRGMLHLQSSDSTIPEMTLVFNEKNVSGWCSTCQIWGRDYFLDEGCPDVRKVAPEVILPILKQFLGRLR